MSGAPRIKRKWRPPLALIVFLVVATVLALPLAGLFFFRIYENQLVRETEAELIAQGALLAAVYAREIETQGVSDASLGAVVPPDAETPKEPYQPISPSLDLASESIAPRRPDALPATAPADPAFVTIGRSLSPVIVKTQRVTLAGFRLLDPQGVVVAGREETGLSLAHVEEVADALKGRFRVALRLRISKHPPPPLYSMSRGTGLRLFVAAPAVVRGRVAGVVYVSRTPSNVFKHLFDERGKVAVASLAVAALAAAIGFVFHRAITQPMRALIARTEAIAKGDRDALQPLTRHGTAELAKLSQSFLDMADALSRRSDFIATFAAHVSHEMKSPLTSIQGAAELLRDDLDAPAMTQEKRRKFLGNILADAQQLTLVVNRLRDLARAERSPIGGAVALKEIASDLRAAFPALEIVLDADGEVILGMSAEDARIVLGHLADNAAQHGARRLLLRVERVAEAARIIVADDGAGISPQNRARIFDSFFTTRRESGGTGMGLPIARAMLRAHGGDIALLESEAGAAFALTLPRPVCARKETAEH